MVSIQSISGSRQKRALAVSCWRQAIAGDERAHRLSRLSTSQANTLV